jgi:hypothetical protein
MIGFDETSVLTPSTLEARSSLVAAHVADHDHDHVYDHDHEIACVSLRTRGG